MHRTPALLAVLAVLTTAAPPIAATQAHTMETYTGHLLLPQVETHEWPNLPGVDVAVLRGVDWAGPQPDLELCFFDKHGFELDCWNRGGAVESGFVPQGTKAYEVRMPAGLDVTYVLYLIEYEA